MSNGYEIYKKFPIRFVRLCNLDIYHFNIALFSTFFIPFFKMLLCAVTHLEPSQTSTRCFIWSFPIRTEFPGLFSVTVSEPAVQICSIKKFAKFCKIYRKTPVTESSYWNIKSKSKIATFDLFLRITFEMPWRSMPLIFQ